MASIRQHRLRWKATIRIPKPLRDRYEGREFLYRNLQAPDRRGAKLEADAWELSYRLKWAEMGGSATQGRASMREVYRHLKDAAAAGEFEVYTDTESDPIETGITFELDKLADKIGPRELTDTESARVAALQDALAIRRSQPVPRRPELEATFRELADDYLKLWRTQQGLKETNTEQQKIATFDLFGGFWGRQGQRCLCGRDQGQRC